MVNRVNFTQVAIDLCSFLMVFGRQCSRVSLCEHRFAHRGGDQRRNPFRGHLRRRANAHLPTVRVSQADDGPVDVGTRMLEGDVGQVANLSSGNLPNRPAKFVDQVLPISSCKQIETSIENQEAWRLGHALSYQAHVVKEELRGWLFSEAVYVDADLPIDEIQVLQWKANQEPFVRR